jgi:predicted dehydrogenase
MVRFGIIGCGNVSQTYLYTLQKNKNSKVVAATDIDKGMAKNKSELFDIPSVYTDYEEMLAKEKLDAVVICTPHFAHHLQFLSCSKQGLDILCEKPLATKMEDIYAMVDASKNIKFSVMLQRRFYPNSIATHNAIVNGEFGKIQEVSLKFTCHKTKEFYGTWRGKKISGGGVLLSQALHRIDQLAFFFGRPMEVEGTIKTTRSYIEVEDYGIGKVYFENGIVANIEADNSSGNPDTISIIKIKGTEGNIVLSDDKTPEWNIESPSPREININAIPTEYRPAYYGPCHEMVIDDFVEAIHDNRDLKIIGKDALASMRIIFGIYESAKKSGERIQL